MSTIDEPDDLSPAERALEGHLQLLRTEPPLPPGHLVARILRNARWQQALRKPLMTFAHFAAAARDGLRLLLQPSREHR